MKRVAPQGEGIVGRELESVEMVEDGLIDAHQGEVHVQESAQFPDISHDRHMHRPGQNRMNGTYNAMYEDYN